jgi:hypothetical protein
VEGGFSMGFFEDYGWLIIAVLVIYLLFAAQENESAPACGFFD